MISGSLPPVSNREDFDLEIELYDEDTDELIDVSGVSEVVIEVRRRSAVLSARLSAGQVVQPELGIFACTFTADQMRGLCAATYDIGGTLTKDGKTTQFIIGTVPVLDGVVSR